MSSFQKQPIHCPNCGVAHLGQPNRPRCSIECYRELEWKHALYIMGEKYYPKPKEEQENAS